MDLSFVYVQSRCIFSHKPGAYTHSFFEIRGWSFALDSPTKKFKGCILQPEVFRCIYPARRDQNI